MPHRPSLSRISPFHFVSVLALLTACSASGCAIETDVDDDDEGWAHSSSELAVPGAWKLPAAVHAAGQEQDVRYDDAPAWQGGAGCGGEILPGTRELGDYLKETFSGVTSYGGYSCRQNTANKAKTSVHGTGRALDVFIRLDDGEADNGKGDEVANWLVKNAERIGVQLVIWDRTMWVAASSGDKAKAYTGPHPHHDHIHLELTTDGAAKRTPFFDEER